MKTTTTDIKLSSAQLDVIDAIKCNKAVRASTATIKTLVTKGIIVAGQATVSTFKTTELCNPALLNTLRLAVNRVWASYAVAMPELGEAVTIIAQGSPVGVNGKIITLDTLAEHESNMHHTLHAIISEMVTNLQAEIATARAEVAVPVVAEATTPTEVATAQIEASPVAEEMPSMPITQPEPTRVIAQWQRGNVTVTARIPVDAAPVAEVQPVGLPSVECEICDEMATTKFGDADVCEGCRVAFSAQLDNAQVGDEVRLVGKLPASPELIINRVGVVQHVTISDHLVVQLHSEIAGKSFSVMVERTSTELVKRATQPSPADITKEATSIQCSMADNTCTVPAKNRCVVCNEGICTEHEVTWCDTTNMSKKILCPSCAYDMPSTDKKKESSLAVDSSKRCECHHCNQRAEEILSLQQRIAELTNQMMTCNQDVPSDPRYLVSKLELSLIPPDALNNPDYAPCHILGCGGDAHDDDTSAAQLLPMSCPKHRIKSPFSCIVAGCGQPSISALVLLCKGHV